MLSIVSVFRWEVERREKNRAGKYFRTQIKGSLTRSEHWTKMLSISGYADMPVFRDMRSQALQSLDGLDECVRVYADLFPMVEGWDEMLSRLAKTHERLRVAWQD